MNTALIVIAVLGAIGTVWYGIRYMHLKAQRDRRVFEPRPQSPSQKDLANLRAKQAAFDRGDDSNLPMLLQKQAE